MNITHGEFLHAVYDFMDSLIGEIHHQNGNGVDTGALFDDTKFYTSPEVMTAIKQLAKDLYRE